LWQSDSFPTPSNGMVRQSLLARADEVIE
jgi:hypothetical protein